MPFDDVPAEPTEPAAPPADGAAAEPTLGEDGLPLEGADGETVEAQLESLKTRWKQLTPADETPWSQAWQVPAAVLGAALLAIGLYLNWPENEADQWDAALDGVEAMLVSRDLDAAREEMNRIGKRIEAAPDDIRARFHEVDGDRLYLSLGRASGVLDAAVADGVGRSNRMEILNRYDEAEALGRELDDDSLHRRVRLLVALGQRDQATAMLDTLADASVAKRLSLIKTMIERERALPDGGNLDAVARLIDRFGVELRAEPDESTRIAEMVWMYRLKAALRLEADDAMRAIDDLTLAIGRVRAEGASRQQEAPLVVDIGQAYRLVGDYRQADAHLRDARRWLDAADPLNADILVGLAEIELARPEGSTRDAQDLFQQVVDNFPGEPAYVDGLIGLADTQGRLRTEGSWAAAIRNFNLAIDKLDEAEPGVMPASRRRDIESRVQSHASFLVSRGEHGRALEFLEAQRRLHPNDTEPADLLRSFGDAHRALAERLRDAAEAVDPRHPGPGEDAAGLIARRAQRRREAAVHFEQAGQHLTRYAMAVSQTDDEGHGEGLWNAATSFDAAQLPDEAIRTYQDFVDTRQSDPRVPEARNRLGRAYMAVGEYAAAIDQFRGLREDYAQTSWAADATVPEAMCHARLDQPDEAERLLRSIIEDHPTVRPESDTYRQALDALGTLYYVRGRERPGEYEQAIDILQQAVDRYADDEAAAPRLTFLLADAYRQSVEQLRQAMATRPSQSERLAFQSQVQQRLATAQDLFGRARTAFDQLPDDTLSPLEQVYRRNTSFYEADCAYDRGQFGNAIELYANAASRWQEHPSALVAMVQIVNAHCELGQFQQARVANGHALDLLERLPDEVFEDESVPMSRQHWEDWLRWTSELDVLAEGR